MAILCKLDSITAAPSDLGELAGEPGTAGNATVLQAPRIPLPEKFDIVTNKPRLFKTISPTKILSSLKKLIFPDYAGGNC